MAKVLLSIVYLFFLSDLKSQTSALLNTDWELRIIHNTKTNKKTFVDEGCRSTLFFNPDSTYRGRGCCNAVIPSYSGNDGVKVKVSRYTAKDNGELTMTQPSHKVKPCLSVNTEQLIFNSWGAANHYSIKADTLVIRCSNSTDLYYIKGK